MIFIFISLISGFRGIIYLAILYVHNGPFPIGTSVISESLEVNAAKS